jgi:hypothetical protein
MPDSRPNAIAVSPSGDVASDYLLVAGNPTRDALIDWGTAPGPFINAFPESSAQGVSFSNPFPAPPTSIIMRNVYTDGGFFVCFVENQTITANGFAFFVRDMLGGSHGPGNLAAVFDWIAILI